MDPDEIKRREDASRVREFWSQRKWPISRERYVFAGEAIEITGKHLFGSEWIADSSPIAANEAARKCFAQVTARLANELAEGRLKFKLRFPDGGDFYSTRSGPAAWNSDNAPDRFLRCMMPGAVLPNRSTPSDENCWIFFERSSLEKLIGVHRSDWHQAFVAVVPLLDLRGGKLPDRAALAATVADRARSLGFDLPSTIADNMAVILLGSEHATPSRAPTAEKLSDEQLAAIFNEKMTQLKALWKQSGKTNRYRVTRDEFHDLCVMIDAEASTGTTRAIYDEWAPHEWRKSGRFPRDKTLRQIAAELNIFVKD